MGTTQTTTPYSSLRYVIMESCMLPSGAWAHRQGEYPKETDARQAFVRAAFEGPGLPIVWSRTLTLVHSGWDGVTRQHIYEPLATRHCD